MDPVSCLYNFLSIGILCYFVIICFLIKKCCMNCGTSCATGDENLCKCYQKIYEGEITPSNHVIVHEGTEKLPISYLLNQQQENEGEYVLGDDGVLYRNEACRECCQNDNISRSSCNSFEDVFILRTKKGECSPCTPSALGLGEGSFKRTASGHSAPTTGMSALGNAGGASGNSQGAIIKGSNISDISELKGVINYGGQSQTGKRLSQTVEFHSELSEHVFTVEGSLASSQASEAKPTGRGSASSCGSLGGAGSPGSPGSPGSCGSRISNKSSVSSGSKKTARSSKSDPGVAGGKGAKGGSPSRSGSACSSLGKPCPSSGSVKKSGGSGSPSPTQSNKGRVGRPGDAGYELNADGTSKYGSKDGVSVGKGSVGAKSDGASVRGYNADGSIGSSVRGAGPQGAGVYGTKSDGGSVRGYNADGSIGSSVRGAGAQGAGVYGADGQRGGPNDGSTRGGVGGQFGGSSSPGMGRSGLLGSGGSGKSCVPTCGSAGSKSPKKQISSSFQLPCGSPDSPCPHKGSKSGRSASPSSAQRQGYGKGGSPASSRGGQYGRGGSPASSRGREYGRDGSPASSRRPNSADGNKNVCTGSGAGSLYSSPGRANSADRNRSSYNGSDARTVCSPCPNSGVASPNSSGAMSPVSSPSSPNQMQSDKYSDVGVKPGTKEVAKKKPSPILKSPSPPREGVVSPRVSIKENFDIITNDGITSAPTFGKDKICDPCPFSIGSDNSSGAGEIGSLSSSRRNDVLSDEYKDNISNKRKPDRSSADYKDLAADDTSRGTKSARFSDARCHSGTCSSRASSSKSCSKCSKGTKSWASSTTPLSSATTATPSFSTTKCSKCSSDTRVSSITSETGTNSLCETTCKTKTGANSSNLSPNAKSNFSSVTTADIDDFREIDPSRSRCENLGSALARSSCGEIQKARALSTCEAIRDPGKDVICEGSDTGAECSGIRKLKEDPNCPSVREIIKTVDKMANPRYAGSPPTSGTSASLRNAQGRSGTSPVTVDAAVIHEISTKVQNCLQHARAIAAKVGGAGGSGGGNVCRRTMRVQASSRGQADSVKVNSNMTLNTKGITINEYKKVDKPFGRNPGIQVKMTNADGNVEKFKRAYTELMSADGGAINIRIRSPCLSTPGKLLCVSTDRNPCCSNSTMNNTTSSTQPTTSSQGRTPKVRYENNSEDEDGGQPSSSQDQSDPQGPSSQDDPSGSQDDPSGSQDGTPKGAVVVYKRPVKQKSPGTNGKPIQGECSPECSSCNKKTCPTSKYYKGRGKKPGKLQVYNVTTSHFSQFGRNFRPPYVKGMPVIDARMYEQYFHPERYRAGESYLKRRREMIQKIKGKCPWM